MKPVEKYHPFFKPVLQKFYPDYQAILEGIRAEFQQLEPDLSFSKSSRNPIDRRILLCGVFLALIRVLDQRGEPFEKIQILCLEVAQRMVAPRNKIHLKLKSLTGKFASSVFFQAMVRLFLADKVSQKGHPDGFRAKILFDKKETFGLGYGVDILECGICKLFQKHQSGQFAKILCEVDHLTSRISGLELVRTGTIANGAEKCDFRFRKKLK